MLETIYGLVSLVMVVFLVVAIRVVHRVFQIIAVRQQAPPPTAWPRVSLIIPCKGAEEGLAEHLRAHFRHDYPNYEILFTLANADDPAVAVIRQAIAEHPHQATRMVVAQRLPHCVEKIANQIAAFDAADPASEVFACADSDGVPCGPGWLRALVAPLQGCAVATGFRWYFPDDRSLVASFNSAWDSTWCVYHGYVGTVWGGAMAFSRRTYQELQLRDHLSRGITDDLVVMLRSQAANQEVQFAPGAMVASQPHQDWGNFFNWAIRQTLLVRLATPRLWLRGFLWTNLHGLFYLLTLWLFLWPGATASYYLPAGALGLVGLLNLWRASLRFRLMNVLFPQKASQFRWLRWRYLFCIPLTDLVAPFITYSSLLRRTVRWRGVAYRLTADGVERLPLPG